MNPYPRSSLLPGVCCIALSLLASAPARAETTASDDRWQFTARVYGWFPGVSGVKGRIALNNTWYAP